MISIECGRRSVWGCRVWCERFAVCGMSPWLSAAFSGMSMTAESQELVVKRSTTARFWAWAGGRISTNVRHGVESCTRLMSIQSNPWYMQKYAHTLIACQARPGTDMHIPLLCVKHV